MAVYTLIDVENGMFDLSLHTILTPPCFAFFWGIIQTANRFKPRFKNPFNLTIAQAQAAGGGKSRQAVNQKQKQMSKIRIDGQWLIKVIPGSKSRYVLANYEINYNLLVPQNVIIPDINTHESKILDTPMSQSLHSDDTPMSQSLHSDDTPMSQSLHSDDTPMSILRSDQKRGDKTTTEAVADIDSEKEAEPYPTIKSDQTIIEGAILSKYRAQVMDRPPSQNALRDALELYSVDQLQEAIERMPDVLKNIEDGNGALGLACKAIKNRWWIPKDEGGNGGTALPSVDECNEAMGKLHEQREGVVSAPESDFTERRIRKVDVLADIDSKLNYYQTVLKGE